jgi:hypothetical protein
MKRILILGAAIAVVASVTMSASAATPVPFPSDKVLQVFVAAQTVTSDGVMTSWFKPGDSVVFRAYAVDPKTKKVVDPKLVKYFYVTIPNVPNVKLKYGATAPGASTGMPWTGTWTVPSTYPSGTVPFKVLIQIKQNTGQQLKGQFVQMPVVPASLNISPTAPSAFSPAAPAGPAGSNNGQPMKLALYVDSVNGTAPAGTQARPIGCTQTNVYKRGERVVVRSWGTDLSDNSVLSNDNVDHATISIPGQPDEAMAWSAHGTVYFWSNFWIIPANYPLGQTTIHVSYTTLSGATGSYDYVINVIPS